MEKWIWATLGAAVSFAAYQTLLKILFSGQNVLLVTAYTLLVGSVTMFTLYLLFSPVKSLGVSSSLIVSVVVTGICLALGNFFINKSFALGGPQSGFTALYVPSLLVLGVLAGILISHETLSLQKFLGLVVIVGGVVVFATA